MTVQDLKILSKQFEMLEEQICDYLTQNHKWGGYDVFEYFELDSDSIIAHVGGRFRGEYDVTTIVISFTDFEQFVKNNKNENINKSFNAFNYGEN